MAKKITATTSAARQVLTEEERAASELPHQRGHETRHQLQQPHERTPPMTDSRTLTLATLRARGACRDQLTLFRAMFGNRVEITEARCIKHAAVFSWGWAASNLLSALAGAAYKAATAPARAAYDDAIVPAGAAYKAATDAAKTTYDATIASAWARAYINDTE